MFTTNGSIHRKRASVKKHGVNRTPGHNDPPKENTEENHRVSSLEQNYAIRLLNLRAALNEKELQLVELREQHISVVNRGAIARRNWEDAIKSKDQVIVQLQKALHAKKCELDRQERVNEENVQRLLQQREDEENAELEQKDRNISLLEAKNAQFVQELVEQQKTITKLKKQLEDRERHCASHLHKIEVINGRVQDLKAALQKKEEAVETQQKYCQDLKALVWKRDAMIGQLQLAEQQLQSALARQEAEYEALECVKDKLQEEKDLAEKNLAELRQNLEHRESSGVHGKCERGLKEKEVFLRKQRRQIQELQKSLGSAEEALSTKCKEQHHLLDENRRLVESYELLKEDFDQAQRKKHQLESNLVAVQERLTSAELVIADAEAEQSAILEATQYASSQNGSVAADATLDQAHAVEEFLELERQSMASIGRGGGAFSRDSKLHEPRNSAAFYPPQPPSPAARRTHSSIRRGTKHSSQSMRSPLTSESLSATFGNKNPLFVEHTQRPPRIPVNSEASQTTRNFYPSSNEPGKKAGRANALSQSHQSGAHHASIFEEKSAGSSESSQPSSPYASDLGLVRDGERSPTLIDAFHNSTIGTLKRTSTSLYTSRERASSQSQRSPPLTEDSQPFSPTDRRSDFSLSAKDSKAEAQGKWRMRETLSLPESLPPASRVAANPNSRMNKGPHSGVPTGQEEASEVSPAPSVELHTRDYPKGRPARNETFPAIANGSTRASGTNRRALQTTAKIPQTGTKPQVARNSKIKESLRPPTPASDQFQASSDSAIKSLQDEVMKRERGWRRTEANMRAVLCQRLAELNEAQQSAKLEKSRVEATRQDVQRRKH